MKASDLLQLVNERSEDAMGKVSYKNDHTPDNHVKNKKMKEVNPLPDKGEKNDKHPKANVGDVKKKEKRSLEGPKVGPRKIKEQAAPGMEVQDLTLPDKFQPFVRPHPKTGQLMIRAVSEPGKPWLPLPVDNKTQATLRQLSVRQDQREQMIAFTALINAAKQQQQAQGSKTMGRQTSHVVGKPLTKAQQAGAAGLSLEPDPGRETFRASIGDDKGYDVEELPPPEEIQAMPAGMGVDEYEPNDVEEITMKGHAPQRRGVVRARESIDNAGSMKKKQPVKQGGPVSKTASVRSGKQNDEPRPTAQVGKPKKKERRSMDENPAPVKDWKGGENEHKKMGVHEGIKELEELLNRKIDTTMLDEMDIPRSEVDPSRATGGIKDMAAKADKKRAEKLQARSTRPKGKPTKGSFWDKVLPDAPKKLEL